MDMKQNYLKIYLPRGNRKKAGLHPFGPLISDVWTDIHRIKHNKYRDEHPCQLPIHLLERIILMSTDEGDIVLDPFVGTGTTVVAAKRIGRSYIGFDIDEKYVKNAQFKLLRENSNSKIGNIWVSWFLDGLTTIRDKDWEELSLNYFIPEPRNKTDHTAIKFISLKNKNRLNRSDKITIKSNKLLLT